MARAMDRKGALYYVRRLFGLFLLLMLGTMLLRVWLGGWWVERRVGWALDSARRHSSIEARNEDLADAVEFLDGYKRYVAGASAFIQGLDTDAIDQVRADIDWYRLRTASVYEYSEHYTYRLRILESFVKNYEVRDLSVMRPRHRCVFTVLMWIFGVATVITLLLKMSTHEWGEI